MLVGPLHPLARAARAALGAAADQLSVGPVYATPTKEGRPAAGLGYVRHAAATAGERPWFAIGGIDLDNVDEVVEAGAERLAVVRVLRDAPDPARGGSSPAQPARGRARRWPTAARASAARRVRPARTRWPHRTWRRRWSAATRAHASATRRPARRSCRSRPGERPGAVTLAVAVVAVALVANLVALDRELRLRRGREDREHPARHAHPHPGRRGDVAGAVLGGARDAGAAGRDDRALRAGPAHGHEARRPPCSSWRSSAWPARSSGCS